MTERVYIGRYDHVDYRTKTKIKSFDVVNIKEEDMRLYKRVHNFFFKLDDYDEYVERQRDRRYLINMAVLKWNNLYGTPGMSGFNLVMGCCTDDLIKNFLKFTKDDILNEACDKYNVEYINEGPKFTLKKMESVCKEIGFDNSEEDMPRGEVIHCLHMLFGKDHERFGTKREDN